MVQVIVTGPAVADLTEILIEIGQEAGYRTSLKYRYRFESLFFIKLSEFPETFQSRPSLGPHIRAGLVHPYIVVYRYDPTDRVVSILRILHSRRRITRKTLAV